MTNPNKDAVPEGAIEAAARAMHSRQENYGDRIPFGDKWQNCAPTYRESMREDARAALSAALPFLSQPHEGIGEDAKPLTIVYTNWRGETAERRVLPLRIWWGSTDWHPEPQWLMTAWDIEKAAERDFAWNGIDFQGDGPALSPIPSPHGEARQPIETAPGTIRICPERDGPCPHGVGCQYRIGAYDCDMKASRAALRSELQPKEPGNG